MFRSKRLSCRLILSSALVLVCAGSTAAFAADLVWPAPPADPLVRLESVLGKLNDFEIAIQGPIEDKPRRIRKLGRPSGIAFDGRGRLLVSDARQRALFQIDTDLGVALVFGTGTTPKLEEPRGVAAHPDGTIYVADAGLRQVVAFDSRGDVVATYGQGALEEPTDVALSPDATRLYVADARANNIGVFDLASGRRVETFGGRGTGIGQFYLPTAVELDRSGSLLVVDQLNERVQVFDPSGTFSRLVELGGGPGASRPHDLAAAGSGRLFVTDSAQSRIQVYDAGLRPLLSFGRNGLGQGEFLGIGGIAVSGDRLAVLDQAGGRVQLFRLYAEPPVSQRHARSTWREARPDPSGETAEALESTRRPEPVEPPGEASAPRDMPGPDARALPAVPEAPEAPPEIAAEDSPTAPKPGPAGGLELTEEPLPAPEPEGPADAARVAQQLLELVKDWAAAWSAQDADRYLGFYSKSFQPEDGSSLKEWSALRRSRISGPDSITVGIEIVETRLDEDGPEITFLQSYRSDRYSDRVRKTLRLVEEDDGWKIAREMVLEKIE